MPDATKIHLTDEERDKCREIKHYLRDTNTPYPVLGDLPGLSPLWRLVRANRNSSLLYLLDAMDEDGININTMVKLQGPDLLDHLDQPPVMDTETLHSHLSDMVPMEARIVDKRTINIVVCNLTARYSNYQAQRTAFGNLRKMDTSLSIAAASLVMNPKHAVALFYDPKVETIYLFHNVDSARQMTTYLEMFIRLLAIVPHIVGYTPSFGLDPFIALVSKDKTKLQPLIDRYIAKYEPLVNDHLLNRKFNAIASLKLFDAHQLERDINSNIHDIEQLEDSIASKYSIINGLRAKLLAAGNDDAFTKELIEYIKKYKPNTLISAEAPSSSKVILTLACDHTYFDDNVLRILNNREGNRMHKSTPIGQLLLGIKDGKFDIRWRGIVIVDIARKSVATGTMSDTTGDYLINPHLNEWGCLGSNRAQITKAITNQNYIGMYEQLLATVGSINLSDGGVTKAALNRIENATYNSILDCSTGEWMPFKQWKEKFYVTP